MSVVGWIGGLASALVVGGGLGWATVNAPYWHGHFAEGFTLLREAVLPDRQTIRVDAWTTSLAIGGADADMFTRAHVARTGLLALNRSETLYFTATRDDSGLPLEARCQYDVVGETITAKWWSLTVYAGDHFLVPDPSNRHSISVKDVKGQFKLLLGPQKRDGLWLPTGQEGGFSLLLRLYNPAAALVADPATLRAPKITRIGGCK